MVHFANAPAPQKGIKAICLHYLLRSQLLLQVNFERTGLPGEALINKGRYKVTQQKPKGDAGSLPTSGWHRDPRKQLCSNK